MKKAIQLLFLLAFSFVSFTKAQSPKFANTLTGTSDQYGIYGTTVFKLDANGNSVWVKDFAGYIATSTYPNELYGSAFDGNNLYILEMQGSNSGTGIPPVMNTAIIKMDTLGNVLFTKYNSIQSPGGYAVTDIFPSFVNGAWIIDNYSSGITTSGRVYKINNAGSIQPILGIWYGSVAYAKKVCLLKDSTYIISADHHASTGGSDVPFSALIKFNESGSIIWQYSYEILNGIIGEGIFEQEMAVDSSGNTYLFENYYGGSSTATVGIKINSLGAVVTSKLWPDIAAYSISAVRFENNEIIAIQNNEEIHFDTSLNNSCLNTQNFSIVTGNKYVPTTPTYTYSSASFTPANSASFTYSSPLYTDYCASSGVDDGKLNISNFSFYPNPATDKITITSSFTGKTTIEILDLQGKLLLKETALMNSNIDISKLSAGIYFLKLSNGSTEEKKILVVER